MKKITLYSLLILFAFSACNSLDEDPKAVIATTNFYKTPADAEAAVIAVHNAINSTTHTLYNRLIQISTEMATDDYEAGPRARNAHVRALSNLTHDASNDRMLELWRQSYDGINRANIAIDKIPTIPNLETQKVNDLVNEAKFLRAVLYFNIVRWFGDVPLILHETGSLSAGELNVSNTPEAQVYAQIEADLIAAEALPVVQKIKGKITAGAAKSLLSKVYLTEKKWQKAAEKSKEVIDSKVYDLFENYADVFNVATKNGKEHIFSAQFKGLTNWNGNMLASTSAPNSVPGIAGDQADALHTAGGLFQAFAEDDTRKYVTFGVEYVSPTDGKTYQTAPHFNKYFDPTTPASPGQSSKNTPIIRFAEVLLIYSEAVNEQSGPTTEAFTGIDRVRTRAGVPLLSVTSPTISKDDFREAVFEERRKELVFEYQRWFDLARRGPEYFVAKLKAAGKNNAQPKHVHFPIPQRELDLNKNLKQVPEWR
ncbi:RagB/SusD family nutrient uptake outer membrane protein [Flavobacterium sp. GA093]|uniref:RagB/SusD family nutrient uptake outer membrane protein n=1 Tax=Flavobacterium hydrocarbonoxydans TaxID=2683249 RepID=A0A6I4NZ75_9FLAO|nr:RagB/SusD family nutrient uptake outer membrane protein [Flavobacterium hydrocarbonoxydans]MWB96244.1 RagB/SusD family nutrient uptake outer membrane protein [Flavobacterium hydrocarbonoxydans]